jgi:hypothetical protein
MGLIEILVTIAVLASVVYFIILGRKNKKESNEQGVAQRKNNSDNQEEL